MRIVTYSTLYPDSTRQGHGIFVETRLRHRSEYAGGENPHPFLADPAVRRALSLAIDRQILVDVGYGAAGQPTCNVLPAPAIYVSTANDECPNPSSARIFACQHSARASAVSTPSPCRCRYSA